MSRIRLSPPRRPAPLLQRAAVSSPAQPQDVPPQDKVAQLLANGFAERVERFKRSEPGLTLREVPEVLDRLLDLDAYELSRLVEHMGLNVAKLRHANGLPVMRLTADYVLQLLARRVRDPLPTQPRDVVRARAALEAEYRRVQARWTAAPEDQKAGLRDELHRLRGACSELEQVGRELKTVSRSEGFSQMGGVLAVSLGWGQSKPKIGGISSLPNLAQRAFGYWRSGIVGFNLSRADRGTGQRTLTPYAQVGADAAIGGVYYTLERGGGRNLDVRFRPPFLSFNSDPICGRHLYLEFIGRFSLTIGERFLGFGYVPYSLTSTKRFEPLEVGPMFLMGIHGDPIQYITGYPIRVLFTAYEKAKARALKRFQRHEVEKSLAQGPPAAMRPVETGRVDWDAFYERLGSSDIRRAS